MQNARFVTLIFFLIMFNFSTLAQVPGVFPGERSRLEAEQRCRETPLVILPSGAGAREYGPHAPTNADRVVMDHLPPFGNETITGPEADVTRDYKKRLADKIAR